MTVWVGTSWKMNKTRAEAAAYARQLSRVRIDPSTKVFVLPSFTSLDVVRRALRRRPEIIVGAQNAHWEDDGAWTGELSMSMVRDAGAGLVELGHSERRAHFGETDATVNLKVRAAIRAGLRPLVCVGDSLADREGRTSVQTVVSQVSRAFAGVTAAEARSVLIAYEPYWAIGAHGRAATVGEIATVHEAILEWATAHERIPAAVLYGGSVDERNAAEILGVPGVGGLFVGRAAWDAVAFGRLIAVVSRRAAEAPEHP